MFTSTLFCIQISRTGFLTGVQPYCTNKACNNLLYIHKTQAYLFHKNGLIWFGQMALYIDLFQKVEIPSPFNLGRLWNVAPFLHQGYIHHVASNFANSEYTKTNLQPLPTVQTKYISQHQLTLSSLKIFDCYLKAVETREQLLEHKHL